MPAITTGYSNRKRWEDRFVVTQIQTTFFQGSDRSSVSLAESNMFWLSLIFTIVLWVILTITAVFSPTYIVSSSDRTWRESTFASTLLWLRSLLASLWRWTSPICMDSSVVKYEPLCFVGWMLIETDVLVWFERKDLRRNEENCFQITPLSCHQWWSWYCSYFWWDSTIDNSPNNVWTITKSCSSLLVRRYFNKNIRWILFLPLFI